MDDGSLAAIGIPEIVPVVASRTRPGGSEPLTVDHESGGVPPVAVSVAVYGPPVCPEGNALIVMLRGVGPDEELDPPPPPQPQSRSVTDSRTENDAAVLSRLLTHAPSTRLFSFALVPSHHQ
jgi:hypothetical protein